jgi:hypothetical protein
MTLRSSKGRTWTAIVVVTAFLIVMVWGNFHQFGPTSQAVVVLFVAAFIEAYLVYSFAMNKITLGGDFIEVPGKLYLPTRVALSDLAGYRTQIFLPSSPAALYLFTHSRPRNPILIRFLSDSDRKRLLEALGLSEYPKDR